MKSKISVHNPVNFSQIFWQSAAFGDIEQVEYFLKSHDVDIEYIHDNATALWMAARNGHDKVIKMLLEHGANVHYKHPSGQSILWSAAEQGHAPCVDLLLQYKAKPDERSNNCTPLYIAAQNNHLDALEILLRHTQNIDAPFLRNGRSALMTATYLGHKAIVKKLIGAGAHVNYSDDKGSTALHIACSGRHFSIVKTLVEAFANVNAEDMRGRSPLAFAFKSPSLTRYLLQSGALPVINQDTINSQFSKYLEYYPILHPNIYPASNIKFIQQKLHSGLCCGYLKIARIMTDAGYEHNLTQTLNSIYCWDRTIESLKINRGLENTIHAYLFNVIALSESDRLRCEGNIIAQFRDPQLYIFNHSYEIVFQTGFVFKYPELEILFNTLLKQGVTLDLSLVLERNNPHIISLTKNQNTFELLDSNVSIVKPAKVSSITCVIRLLREISNANEKNIGFSLSISMRTPSSNTKATYLKIQTDFNKSLITSRLLDHEINLEDENNLTSLFYSIYDLDKPTAKTLIAHNAGAALSMGFINPIYIAVQTDNSDLVTLLLQSGSDVNYKFNGNTLLHCAAGLGLLNMVQLLIAADARINDSGTDGVTALYLACQSGFYSIAKLLIHNLANVNQQLCFGMTPLTISITNRYTALVSLLIENGVDINASVDSTTPLGIAIEKGFLDCVKLLVTAGAKLSNVYHDISAIEYAKQKGCHAIVDYLDCLNAVKGQPRYQSFEIRRRQEKIHRSRTCAGSLNPELKMVALGNILFFKPDSLEGKSLIKSRHASPQRQKAYDEHYGLVTLHAMA